MRKPRSALLFFVLLVLGLSLMVPVEDLPETAYDESENLPFAAASLILDVVPQPSSPTVQSVPSLLGDQPATSCGAFHTRITGSELHPDVQARVVLAILCIHRC